MPAHAYNRKVRNWFRAYVDNFMGDTQLAKDIMKYGCHSTHLVEHLVKATNLVKATDWDHWILLLLLMD